jgi:uncharacterized protein DUF3500
MCRSLTRAVPAVAAAVALAVSGCGGAEPTAPTDAQPSPSVAGPEVRAITVALNSDGTSPGGANTEEVVEALTAFLGTLDAAARDAVCHEFTDGKDRQTWSDHPVSAVPRPGLALAAFTASQRAAALKVLEVALSDDGFAQVEAIRAADEHLGGPELGADTYHLAIYGTPSSTEPFMVQFGGHHLARNLTYHGDRVSQTPSLTGAEPVTFDDDEGTVIEPMKAEATALFAAFHGLSPEERAAARLSTGTYDDLLMGPGQDAAEFPESEGLLISELGVRKQVTAAIDAYVSDLDDEAAGRLLDKYEAEYPRTRLSWTGDAAEATYLRIDGPSVWIEFLSTAESRSTPGVHYHSVYRDKTNDYGSA